MTIQTVARIEAFNNQVLDFLRIGNEYRIDSRDVAPNIGIEHESLIKTLRTYQEQLEHFGLLRFEIGKPPKGSAGGRPETYVMLNRNQVLFAVTLSRNTEQVVAWKMALIDALDQLEKQVTRPYQASLSSSSTPDLKENVLDILAKRFQPGERFNRRRMIERGNRIIRSTRAVSVGIALDELVQEKYIDKAGNGRCALYWLLRPIQ